MSVSGRTLASSFRGLYRRVAKQLRLDESYVSRVARGERSNAQVLQVLQTETKQLLRRNHQVRGNFFPEANRMLEVQRLKHTVRQLDTAMKDTVKLAKVQLDTALLLLEMAAHAGLTSDRRRRSLQGANRGYKTAERLLKQIRLTPSDAREIQKRRKEFEFLSRLI